VQVTGTPSCSRRPTDVTKLRVPILGRRCALLAACMKVGSCFETRLHAKRQTAPLVH